MVCMHSFLLDQALTIFRIYIGPLNMESVVVAEYGSGRGRDVYLVALMMGCNSPSLVIPVTRQRLTLEDCWEKSRSENSVLLPRDTVG